jgi:maleate isomerase
MSSSDGRWQPDGWEASVRIGVLTPHADLGRSPSCRRWRPPA